MTAGRLVAGMAVVTSLLAAAPVARAAHRIEADPHQMYEEARDAVAHGDLRTAQATLARLRELVAQHPEWDPDGVFTNQMLPPIETRLKRLLETGRQLDEFTEGSLRTLRPPDLKQDISTVREYTDWATSVIQRLRDDRDRIIAASLPDPEDRAILAHTESYARTERLLEVDVLKKMAASAGDDILGLLAGDPQLESVLVRFRQLKRDLMDAVAAKTAIAKQLKASEARDQAMQRLLGAVVTDGAGPGAEGRPGGTAADLFPRFLDERQAAVGRTGGVTAVERGLLRAELDRAARLNRLLVGAGVVPDQGARIASLAKAIDALPATTDAGPAGRFGPVALCLVAALAAAAGAAGGVAWARLRRRVTPARFGDHTIPLHYRTTDATAADAASATTDADDRRKAV